MVFNFLKNFNFSLKFFILKVFKLFMKNFTTQISSRRTISLTHSLHSIPPWNKIQSPLTGICKFRICAMSYVDFVPCSHDGGCRPAGWEAATPARPGPGSCASCASCATYGNERRERWRRRVSRVMRPDCGPGRPRLRSGQSGALAPRFVSGGQSPQSPQSRRVGGPRRRSPRPVPTMRYPSAQPRRVSIRGSSNFTLFGLSYEGARKEMGLCCTEAARREHRDDRGRREASGPGRRRPREDRGGD